MAGPAHAGGGGDGVNADGLIADDQGKWLERLFTLMSYCQRTAVVRGLCAYGRLVLLDDVRRDTAAVLDLDALLLSPLADLGGINGAVSA